MLHSNLSIKICQPADLRTQNIFGVWFQGDLSSSVGRGMYYGEEFQAITPRVASQQLKPTRNTRIRARLVLSAQPRQPWVFQPERNWLENRPTLRTKSVARHCCFSWCTAGSLKWSRKAASFSVARAKENELKLKIREMGCYNWLRLEYFEVGEKGYLSRLNAVNYKITCTCHLCGLTNNWESGGFFSS